MQKVLPFKRTKVAIALMSSAMILACSGDFEPSSRIVVEDDSPANPPVAPASVSAQFDINGATIDYFDLQDGQNVASSTFAASTIDSRPSSADVELKAGASSPRGVLVRLTVPAGTQYFDPITRKSTTLQEARELYAISKSRSLNLLPTPFSTLALYRALARTGWFYDNDSLPSAVELSQILSVNRDDFFQQYDDAKKELGGILVFPEFQSNLKIFEGYSQINDESTLNAAVYNYAALAAQLRVYADRFDTTTPYFDLAADLSTDFFDGDIDGKTFKGVVPQLGITTLVTSPSNQDIVFDPTAANIFEDIYDNQVETLEDFEQQVSAKVPDLITELSLNSATATRLSALFNPSDASESPSDETSPDQSYADFARASLGPFRGVGNKTFGFGLPSADGAATQKSFLGLPQNSLSALSTVIVEIQQIYGRYAGTNNSGTNNCQLIVGANGVIELISGSDQFKAVLDRDANDTLYKLNASDYRLNAATAIDSGSDTNRVIQLEVSGSSVLSARTAIVNQLGSDVLENPELSCNFQD